MAKPLISTSTGGAGTPTATYAVVGTLLLHAAVFAGLSFVDVGEPGERSIQAPQLQLRKGEQVMEVRLRPMVNPSQPTTKQTASPNPLSDAWPSDVLDVEFTPEVELPSSQRANTPSLSSRPTESSTDAVPMAIGSSASLATAAVEEIQQPKPSVEIASNPSPSEPAFSFAPPDVETTFKVAAVPTVTQDTTSMVDRNPGITSGVEIKSLAKPKYPSLSRRRGEEGTVLLHIEVHKDGTTGKIQVIQDPGYKRLVSAAIAAARKGQFTPAMENGRPVAGHVVIPFQFVLTR